MFGSSKHAHASSAELGFPMQWGSDRVGAKEACTCIMQLLQLTARGAAITLAYAVAIVQSLCAAGLSLSPHYQDNA